MYNEAKLVVDDGWQILGEYTRNRYSIGADVGDRFLQWALRSEANSQWCTLVTTTPINNLEKVYVVQTNGRIVERCLFMTTDPGDLALDPTCVRKGTKIFSVQDPNPPVSPRKRGEEFSSPPSVSFSTFPSADGAIEKEPQIHSDVQPSPPACGGGRGGQPNTH